MFFVLRFLGAYVRGVRLERLWKFCFEFVFREIISYCFGALLVIENFVFSSSILLTALTFIKENLF